MAYRETPKIAARKENIRQRILKAAAELTGEKGFSGTAVSAIAARAGVATGSVYRYFPNKTALCTEVFRNATSREVEQVRQALQGPGSARDRLERAVSVFADRAIRARRLAYSLIAEPVDPALDQERLNYREQYAQLFADFIEAGIRNHEISPQHPKVTGAAIVGALAESLVGPLAAMLRPEAASEMDKNAPRETARHRELIAEITAFCLRAVGLRDHQRSA